LPCVAFVQFDSFAVKIHSFAVQLTHSPSENGLQKYTTCPTWPNLFVFFLKKHYLCRTKHKPNNKHKTLKTNEETPRDPLPRPHADHHRRGTRRKNQECTTIVSTLHSFFDNDTKRNLRAFLQ
jgi:hypothetical protein